jgi:hypothetical protein
MVSFTFVCVGSVFHGIHISVFGQKRDDIAVVCFYVFPGLSFGQGSHSGSAAPGNAAHNGNGQIP